MKGQRDWERRRLRESEERKVGGRKTGRRGDTTYSMGLISSGDIANISGLK